MSDINYLRCTHCGITNAKVSKRLSYIEGKLLCFNYNAQQVLLLGDELEELEINATTLKSPRIKNQMESMYQTCRYAEPVRVGTMMQNKTNLARRLRKHEAELNEIGAFLQTLEPEEVELLSYRYEMKLTVRTIAQLKYSSKSQIYRKIEQILEKY